MFVNGKPERELITLCRKRLYVVSTLSVSRWCEQEKVIAAGKCVDMFLIGYRGTSRRSIYMTYFQKSGRFLVVDDRLYCLSVLQNNKKEMKTDCLGNDGF